MWEGERLERSKHWNRSAAAVYLPVRARECTQPCIRDLAF